MVDKPLSFSNCPFHRSVPGWAGDWPAARVATGLLGTQGLPARSDLRLPRRGRRERSGHLQDSGGPAPGLQTGHVMRIK